MLHAPHVVVTFADAPPPPLLRYYLVEMHEIGQLLASARKHRRAAVFAAVKKVLNSSGKIMHHRRSTCSTPNHYDTRHWPYAHTPACYRGIG